MTLTSACIAKIRRLTADNHHTAALVAGAKALGCSHLEREFQTIDAQLIQMGYLPPAVRGKRDSLYDELMAAAKGKLTAEGYERFYASF